MLDKYKLVGASYDFLSKVYSGNAIHECKLSMLREDTIGQGSKVLFAGAGQGRDAIHAAELGAEVTIIDISPTMLKQFNKHLSEHPNKGELSIKAIQSDILKIEQFGEFDMVVANFFLNVFDREIMSALLNHLNKLCRSGGKLVIGDFCPSQGGVLNRSIQNIYWYAAATAFFAAAGNAIHQIYDYAPMLEKLGLNIKEKKSFQVLGRDLYCSLLAEKTLKR